MSYNNISKMSFLSRVFSATKTLTGAVYNASVEAFKEVIGRPAEDKVTIEPQPEGSVLDLIDEEDEIESVELDFNDVVVGEPKKFFRGDQEVSIQSYELPINDTLAASSQLNIPAEKMLEEYFTPAVNKKVHFRVTYEYQGKKIESTKYVSSADEALELFEELTEDLLNKYDGIEVTSLFLEVITFPNEFAVQGSKYAKSCYNLPEEGCVLRIDANNIIYNPSTKDNCLFHSICVSLDPTLIGRNRMSSIGKTKPDPKQNPLVVKASKLKRASGCVNRVSTLDDAETVAKFAKCSINVTDNTGKLIKRFSYGKHEITLIFHNGHCYANIPYTEPIDFMDRNKEPRETMRKFSQEKNRDTNFYAADLEAFTDERHLSVAYSIGYGYYNKDGEEEYLEFIGHENCLELFFESLIEDKTNKTIYFHNGGKYDMNVIIQQFLMKNAKFKIDNKYKVYLNGRYAKFVVCYEKIRLTFLDSICFFSLSLDQATGKKGFNVKTKKLSGNINHNLVTKDNYREVMANGTGSGVSGSQYLRNDVIGLLECLDSFGREIWDEYNINITKVISASSISKRIFKQNFLDEAKYPIHLLTKEQDDFIQESYHGGRTECFYKGMYTTKSVEKLDYPVREGKLFYYDFTSLYPSVCAVGDCDLPYGRCHPLNLNNIFKKDEVIKSDDCIKFLEKKAVFMKCLVRSIDFKRKPLHCVPSGRERRLVFPYFNDWTEIHLTSAEILLGIKEKMYEYKPVQGYWFKKAPVLKEYFMQLFLKKQEASKAGQDAKALCYKIIANSGYGFWALKTSNRPDIDIIDSTDYNSFLLRVLNDFDDMYECGGKIVIQYKKSIENVEKNIALGSYITSLARIKLWSLMDAVEQKGGTIVYADTDSAIMNLKLEDYPDLMERFCWDGCGSALGALKNEIKDAVRKDCGKKGIPVQDKDCIDYSYFAGLKSYRYSLEYEYEGQTYCINDSKLKGYKQHGEFCPVEDNVRTLGDDDYVNILKGNSIVQKVSQFSSNKSGSKQEWQKITKIEKSFKYGYSKGRVLDSGTIEPWCFPRDYDEFSGIKDIEVD